LNFDIFINPRRNISITNLYVKNLSNNQLNSSNKSK